MAQEHRESERPDPESRSAGRAIESVGESDPSVVDPTEPTAEMGAEPALERTVQILEAKLNLHRGPLPSPEALEAYERIQPGTAERMMRRWEVQSDHRMDQEARQIDANIKARTRGQYTGMVVALTVIVGGFVAIYLDKPLAGIAALVLAAATIAGRFIVASSRGVEQPQPSETESD